MSEGSETADRTAFVPAVPPLSPDMRWHVFLSYRSVDRAWVINLYDVLRGHGFEVFLDQCVIQAGDTLLERIEQGLTASAAGVLIWSSATGDSEWCKHEYSTMESRASDSSFRFVPIQLDSTPLPAFARTRLFLGFSDYPEGPNGGELLRLLHGIVGQAMPPEAVRFATAQTELVRKATAAVRAAIEAGNSARLTELAGSPTAPWSTNSVLGCRAAEGLTRLGCYDEALAVLQTLSERFPHAIRPQQLKALALARRGGPGDVEAAQEVIGELFHGGHRDPETVGIYARTWTDRFAKSKDSRHLVHARDLYRAAFVAAPDDYYCGINAAAKSVMLGDDEIPAARELAERLLKTLGRAAVLGDYWRTATIAEALLIRGEYEEAARLYRAAVVDAPCEVGSHASTALQARRLMDRLQPSAAARAAVEAAFTA